MPRAYMPDAWVILRITALDTNEVCHKVLAGWYGGFAGSDSWQLNSGITKIERAEDGCYEIHGASGSTYRCHANCQRMSGYMSSVFQSFVKDAEGKGTLEVVDIQTILKDYP